MTPTVVLIICFLIGAAIALITTPLTKTLAFRFGALAHPGGRHIHENATPSWGGLAIMLGFVISGPIFGSLLGAEQLPTQPLIGLLLGSGMMVAMGAIDDRYRLPARIKFAIQIAGAALLPAFGAGVTVISNPFSEGMFYLPGWLSWIVTIIWVVAVTNAINLIDGIDGLAAGVSAISCIALATIGILRDQPAIALIAAALAGGASGFLPWNFNPAKVFMGDVGAYFIGFLIGGLTVMGAFKVATAISIFVPLLVLAVPLLEFGMSTFRRYMRGQPIFAADREHLHHRLLDMGLSHRAIAILMYSVTAVCCMIAIWISRPQ